MSIVMITGGIDISVGGVVALVSMSCAVWLDKKDGNVFTAILLALAIGLAFGVVQGFLVAYLDIQPFIVTLAGMFFARGMTTIVNTNPFNVENEAFVALKDTRVVIPGMGSVNKIGKYVDAYIEIGVIVALIVVVLFFCILRWTKLGRSFYAVGGNKQSALMLGINVKRTKFLSHLLCGLLADRRICLFHACRLRFSVPCDGNGNERHCFLHYRRHHADRRRRKYHRKLLRSAFFKHDPADRCFGRTGRGVVDGNYHCRYAVSVPCGTEYCNIR